MRGREMSVSSAQPRPRSGPRRIAVGNCDKEHAELEDDTRKLQAPSVCCQCATGTLTSIPIQPQTLPGRLTGARMFIDFRSGKAM